MGAHLLGSLGRATIATCYVTCHLQIATSLGASCRVQPPTRLRHTTYIPGPIFGLMDALLLVRIVVSFMIGGPMLVISPYLASEKLDGHLPA